MLACDTRDAWTQFLQFVKTRCSVTAFGNWFAPIHVIEASAEEITLEVPNIFVQEYLITNYKKDLCAFLPVNANGEPAIHFVIAPSQKKPMPQPLFHCHSRKRAQDTRRLSRSQTESQLSL